MIYTISKANKVEYVYQKLKEFCKKAKVPYRASELAHWIRMNVESPLMRFIISKDDESIKGFTIFYVSSEQMNISKAKLFVSQFYAECKEAKQELADFIVNFCKAEGISAIEYHTYHDPKWMIERFAECGYEFSPHGTILRMDVQEV